MPKDILLIFFFILLHINAAMGRDLSFTNLSVEDGLSNNEVNTIFKDSYGFMWFGTLHGLDRFDGVEIRPYASKFPEQIENVYAITEDFKRRLWVGTSQGLFKQDINTANFSFVSIDTVQISVLSIVQISDSSLFIGTNNGLYIYEPTTGSSEHVDLFSEEKGKSNYITGMWLDNHNNCWLSTHYGLFRYSVRDNKNECFLFESEQKEANNTFTSICNIGNKIYLGSSYSGIIEFDLFSKTFAKGINIGNQLILTIHDDDKENLFVGTNGGGLKIVNIRTKEVKSIQKEENNPKSISSNSIYSFYLDEYERYWIGTYSAGVNYSGVTFGNFNLHPVTTQHPEVNESIRSFYFAPDGNNYFGTRNGFVFSNQENEVSVYHATTGKESLRSNIVLSVFLYNDDILLGTYGGGISKFSVSEHVVKGFLGKELFRQGNTYDFETDKDGNLWIATFNGIYKYSQASKTFINYNKENSMLVDDRIFDIKIDSKRRLWIGTMSGTSVFEIDGDNLENLKLPASYLNSYKTNYIYEDQAGNIWICTEVGGLYLLDPELSTSKNYRDQHGLPDNSTCAIIESSAGVYWISSLKGFCKFSLQNEEFTNFSVSDGLPGLVFTPAAVHASNDGKIWFGNEKGLVWFYPGEIVKRTINSNIVITDLYISGKLVKLEENQVLNKPIEITKKIELKQSVSNIGFRFVDLNYLKPFDNNYFYKLEGFDNDWQESGSNQTIFYDNLKPGEYIFRVMNRLDPNLTSTNITELKIRVIQPIYKSPFFIVLIILFILASVFFVFKYVTRLLRIKSKYVKEHTEIEKYKSSNLTDTEREEMIQKLSTYMKSKKPYLNPELKLADIANDINMPIHNISQAINQSLNQSFSDFVNQYRVEEVKELMKKDTPQKFTLIAIATQCGFNSKTSFYRVFKKMTGKTPSEYLNEIR